jgi:hypothetical protein
LENHFNGKVLGFQFLLKGRYRVHAAEGGFTFQLHRENTWFQDPVGAFPII